MGRGPGARVLPGGTQSGVITVLARETIQRGEGQNETERNGLQKYNIAANDKGITPVINGLGNPPESAWEARTLPLSYARSLQRIVRWRSSTSQGSGHSRYGLNSATANFFFPTLRRRC